MPANPLSARVIVLSWAVAGVVWPVVWWLQAAAQGLGVAFAGGEWIGVAVPLGNAPWGLVNEPGVGFAATRAALVSYWLAAPLLAVLVALLVAPLAPGGGRWVGELAVFHTAFASVTLGLGWGPALGRADGVVAGLARFWAVSPPVALAVAALAAAALVQLPVIRLGSALWAAPGGPLRRRRVGMVLAHGGAPALGWVALAIGAGWRPAPLAVGMLFAGVAAAACGAFALVPHAARWRPSRPGGGGVLVSWLLAAVVGAVAVWAGAPLASGCKALLWGRETATSNVRPAMTRVELRRLRVPPAPPAPSATGS